MNYLKNYPLNIGITLILIAGGLNIMFDDNFTITIVAGIVALIGFILMLRGIKQLNKSQEN